jgi:hypothetical protein
MLSVILLCVLVAAIIGASAESASRDNSTKTTDAGRLNGVSKDSPDPDLGGAVNEVTPGETRLVCVNLPGINLPRTNALDWRVARRWTAVKAELDAKGLHITANYDFRTSCQQAHMRGTYGIAAPPGSSMHESGAAIDINGIGTKSPGQQFGTLTPLGQQVVPIFRKYGFVWLPFDPMHVEVRPEMLGEPDKFSLIRKAQTDYDRGDPTGGCRGDRCAL